MPQCYKGSCAPLRPPAFFGEEGHPGRTGFPSSPTPSILFRLFRGAAPKDPVYKWGS